jgi:tetratricopeptide (TPR) repeat protein
VKPKQLIFLSAILVVLLNCAAGFVGARMVWKHARESRAHAYIRMAYGCSRKSDWEQAILYYTKAIELSPKNAVAYYNRGDAYFQLKQYDKAIDDFTSAISIPPTDWMALDYRGLAYGTKGDTTNAIRDFNKAIQLQPKDALLYHRRGYAYAVEKQWDKAGSNYIEAIQLNPTNAISYEGLAYTYFQRRDPINAVKNYDMALQLNPSQPAFLNSLAWFLSVYPDASIRNGQKAVNLAEKACELSHWEKWYCIGTLAAAYAETGDFTNAVKYQEQALHLDGASDKELLEEQDRLKLYEQHQPFHETLKIEKDNGALK